MLAVNIVGDEELVFALVVRCGDKASQHLLRAYLIVDDTV
jgi:hypothetical protein